MVGFAEDNNHPAELEGLRQENERLRALVYAAQRDLDAITRSTSWRLTAPLRIPFRMMATVLATFRQRQRPQQRDRSVGVAMDDKGYAVWLKLEDDDRRRHARDLKNRLATAKTAQISMIMVVHNDPEQAVVASITSLQAQVFGNWQLCVVDAASSATYVAGMCARLSDDSRIRIRRQETTDRALALNAALELAGGDLIGLLTPGECLASDALAELALRFCDHDGVSLAYADEDRIDETGARSRPRFKGGWSPDLLLADPVAVGRPWLMRRATIAAAGGFRSRYEGAEEYDLLLRATRQLSEDQVAHAPHVLMHRPLTARTSPNGAEQAALEAARSEDPDARLLRQPMGHWFEWSHRPRCVSVIIPTRDRADLLAGAAMAVLAEDGVDLELLIVDNGSQEDETVRLFTKLRADPRVRILSMPGAFNWSVLNNAAATEAQGDVLLLLNNDIAAIERGWLAPLVAEAMRPAVGIVGAKLFYPDDTVQHAGVWFARGGGPTHLLRHANKSDNGYLGQLALPRNLLAVTGACLAIRRAVFAEIGGADEDFPISFNDIDLCMRVRAAGYRVLWTPFVRLRHLEAATRGDPGSGTRHAAEQLAFVQFRDIWAARVGFDPFFNANLDLDPHGRLMLIHPQRSV